MLPLLPFPGPEWHSPMPRTILAAALASLAAVPAAAQEAKTADPPPVQMTAQQDHKRMMELLKIKGLRPGANGSNPQAPNAANYDESKANPYPNLPDPLVLKNGKKVTTAEMWWKRRRAEIVEDFDREIYGRVPRHDPQGDVGGDRDDQETVGDVPVVTKQLVGHVDNSSYPQITVDIQLTLTTPAGSRAGAGRDGVRVRASAEAGRPRDGAEPAPRSQAPPPGGPTWQQQVLRKGWGYAILMPNSIQADNGAGLTRASSACVNKGQPRKRGRLGRAARLGLGREPRPRLLRDRQGRGRQAGRHRRAIRATARPRSWRWPTTRASPSAFVSSSGQGGAKLHRRNWGEMVENVAGSASTTGWPATSSSTPGRSPGTTCRWIRTNWSPCARRARCSSARARSKRRGGWVDAKGMFLAGAGAGPVYRLLGKKDLGTTEFPADRDGADRRRRRVPPAQRRPHGRPELADFLEFAGRYLQGPPPAAK